MRVSDHEAFQRWQHDQVLVGPPRVPADRHWHSGTDDNPTLECLEGEKDFIYDKDNDTVRCVDQPKPAADATTTTGT